ncbi:MAG TPA: hypothetical protein VN030_03760 [Cellvibrio sp.]|nr:hypothetical protein [Cellvibrio sp.]
MRNLQYWGALAALVEAVTFIAGFVLYFTLLGAANYGSLDIDPIKNVIFLAEHKVLMHTWYFTIYIVFGIFLVVLALSLYQRLKLSAPALIQVATAFGLIWAGLVIASGLVANIGAETVINLYLKDPAQAASMWLALQFVVNGLGGGNEIIGGIWVLLVSVAATGRLPSLLNGLGMLIGFAGVASSAPMMGALGAVFGLGLILWFFWLAVVMLRPASPGLDRISDKTI